MAENEREILPSTGNQVPAPQASRVSVYEHASVLLALNAFTVVGVAMLAAFPAYIVAGGLCFAVGVIACLGWAYNERARRERRASSVAAIGIAVFVAIGLMEAATFLPSAGFHVANTPLFAFIGVGGFFLLAAVGVYFWRFKNNKAVAPAPVVSSANQQESTPIDQPASSLAPTYNQGQTPEEFFRLHPPTDVQLNPAHEGSERSLESREETPPVSSSLVEGGAVSRRAGRRARRGSTLPPAGSHLAPSDSLTTQEGGATEPVADPLSNSGLSEFSRRQTGGSPATSSELDGELDFDDPSDPPTPSSRPDASFRAPDSKRALLTTPFALKPGATPAPLSAKQAALIVQKAKQESDAKSATAATKVTLEEFNLWAAYRVQIPGQGLLERTESEDSPEVFNTVSNRLLSEVYENINKKMPKNSGFNGYGLDTSALRSSERFAEIIVQVNQQGLTEGARQLLCLDHHLRICSVNNLVTAINTRMEEADFALPEQIRLANLINLLAQPFQGEVYTALKTKISKFVADQIKHASFSDTQAGQVAELIKLLPNQMQKEIYFQLPKGVDDLQKSKLVQAKLLYDLGFVPTIASQSNDEELTILVGEIALCDFNLETRQWTFTAWYDAEGSLVNQKAKTLMQSLQGKSQAVQLNVYIQLLQLATAGEAGTDKTAQGLIGKVVQQLEKELLKDPEYLKLFFDNGSFIPFMNKTAPEQLGLLFFDVVPAKKDSKAPASSAVLNHSVTGYLNLIEFFSTLDPITPTQKSNLTALIQYAPVSVYEAMPAHSDYRQMLGKMGVDIATEKRKIKCYYDGTWSIGNPLTQQNVEDIETSLEFTPPAASVSDSKRASSTVIDIYTFDKLAVHYAAQGLESSKKPVLEKMEGQLLEQIHNEAKGSPKRRAGLDADWPPAQLSAEPPSTPSLSDIPLKRAKFALQLYVDKKTDLMHRLFALNYHLPKFTEAELAGAIKDMSDKPDSKSEWLVPFLKELRENLSSLEVYMQLRAILPAHHPLKAKLPTILKDFLSGSPQMVEGFVKKMAEAKEPQTEPLKEWLDVATDRGDLFAMFKGLHNYVGAFRREIYQYICTKHYDKAKSEILLGSESLVHFLLTTDRLLENFIERHFNSDIQWIVSAVIKQPEPARDPALIRMIDFYCKLREEICRTAAAGQNFLIIFKNIKKVEDRHKAINMLLAHPAAYQAFFCTQGVRGLADGFKPDTSKDALLVDMLKKCCEFKGGVWEDPAQNKIAAENLLVILDGITDLAQKRQALNVLLKKNVAVGRVFLQQKMASAYLSSRRVYQITTLLKELYPQPGDLEGLKEAYANLIPLWNAQEFYPNLVQLYDEAPEEIQGYVKGLEAFEGVQRSTPHANAIVKATKSVLPPAFRGPQSSFVAAPAAFFSSSASSAPDPATLQSSDNAPQTVAAQPPSAAPQPAANGNKPSGDS